jgi:hypothetical protein
VKKDARVQTFGALVSELTADGKVPPTGIFDVFDQTEALMTTERAPLAQHSSGSPDWGTPFVVRLFCATFLAPAAKWATSIDLDYASSAYWQEHWPEGAQPSSYLDGAKGRDVLVEADRHAAVKTKTCGAGFLNPPGLDGGRMIQRCWELFESDHRAGWLDSGAFVGFSLEQLASLQGVGERNPLSAGVITVIPCRRIRYELHPEALIALLLKKQGKRVRGSDPWIAEQRQIEKLRQRDSDAPVQGLAPTHASYLTLLPSHSAKIRRKQFSAVRRFLKSQASESRSPFQRVEIVGSLAS